MDTSKKITFNKNSNYNKANETGILNIKIISFVVISLLALIILFFSQQRNVSASSGLKIYNYTTKENVTYTGKLVSSTYNGGRVSRDKAPGIILDNTSLVPYKDVFVKSPIKAEWEYNKPAQTVTLKKNNNTIVLTIGSKTALVNGKKVNMSAAPVKIKYRDNGIVNILVPANFVAINLGYTYLWDNSTVTSALTGNFLPLSYDNGIPFNYTGTKGAVTYNEDHINLNNMPTIIFEGTAMVRAKRVFDNGIGAKYTYTSKDKSIRLELEDQVLVMTIGSKTAYLNDEQVSLSKAPMLVKNMETGTSFVMVPGKSTANHLGLYYDWNGSTKTSEIADTYPDPLPEKPPTANTGGVIIPRPDDININSISDTDSYLTNSFTITINGDHRDLINTNTIEINVPAIENATVSLDDNGNTQIKFSTKKIQAYKIDLDKENIYIDVGNPKDIYKNIIVLDPGHGGSDPGATSKNGSGKVITEKELNYTILYVKLRELFNNNPDIKTYYTRVDDKFIELSDRASFASKVGADLFVSLHMNSFGSSTANGTEVYYSTNNNSKSSSGINSQIMAKAFHDDLTKSLATTKRGVKTAKFTVIHRNTVPSVLIELGFISNPKELVMLTNPKKQELAAGTMYNTICNLFAEYPTKR